MATDKAILNSSILGLKEETTAGTLIDPAAATDFTVLREGFTFESGVETIDSDELTGDIGAAKSILSKETPSASISKYLKASAVEGQAPDYGIMVESAFGAVRTQTEYDTVAGSTAGSTSARAVVKVDAAEGVNYQKGTAILLKDLVGGYSIRNIHDISTDDLSLNFNLSAAPASGVNLGKAVQYYPASSGHPTYSMHLYQALSGSAFKAAMSGCRTTSMSIGLNATELATIDFSVEGIAYYFNPIRISASNKYIDFKDDLGGALAAILTEKVYKTPIELATEISNKMTAASVGAGNDTITCTYSSTTGKFTISSTGSTFEILFLTGTNNANWCSVLGFSKTDKTAATSYTGEAAITFDPAYTPSYDLSDPVAIKAGQLMIGDFHENFCRDANEASFTIETPKTDLNSVCADSGVSESLVLERNATFTTTVYLKKYEVGLFDKFINNTTTSLMFNFGPKSAGNWVAGKCINIYMANASITSNVIAEVNGIVAFSIEAKGFVTSTQKDIYLNFV